MKLPYQTARGRRKGSRMGRERAGRVWAYIHEHYDDIGIGIMIVIITVAISAAFFNAMERATGTNYYDLNRDGKVNSIDATIAYKIANHEWQATDEMIERADVNRDGFVNQADIDKIVDEIMGRNK